MDISRQYVLDVRTGIGLVIANMIGSGVFLSTGFMMQNLSPGLILLSWMIGAIIAICGATAYAQISRINGRSGGEYRYLYDYLHPYIGYLAGWASLLIGFSAPVAIDAFAVGAFLQKIGVNFSPQITGSIAILCITLTHCFRFSWSRSIQNTLVSVKFFFILIFIAIGLLWGSNTWPQWEPAAVHDGSSISDFLGNQYWIAFAFSGWNAAIYIAGEYHNPKRDVFLSLIFGCLIVSILYLTINWIFVANLTPNQSLAVFDHEKTQVTLAHITLQQIIGPAGAKAASMVACLIFISAISSMTLVGPRIYVQMADDGLLPKVFNGNEGKPPLFSILFQSSVAFFLLHTQSIREIMQSCSAVLMLFSMLTVLILFKIHRNKSLPDVPLFSLFAALIYVISIVGILYSGISSTNDISYVFAIILILGSAGYLKATRYAKVKGV
jgi:APA family basic amino acid/polyamine antiporter